MTSTGTAGGAAANGGPGNGGNAADGGDGKVVITPSCSGGCGGTEFHILSRDTSTQVTVQETAGSTPDEAADVITRQILNRGFTGRKPWEPEPEDLEPAQVVTLGDLCKRFLKTKETNKPSTRAFYGHTVSIILRDFGAGMPLPLIDTEACELFMLDRRKQVAAATANRSLVVLRQLLRKARRWYHTGSNITLDTRSIAWQSTCSLRSGSTTGSRRTTATRRKSTCSPGVGEWLRVGRFTPVAVAEPER